MKKKILVCGSAGFLMSNFMRYILYRSKEFEIVSVDKLINPDDYKRVYLNKNHRFYIGDITDEYFMDRLIKIERPDCIINGVKYFSTYIQDMQNDDILISKYNIPIIKISYDRGGFDSHSTQFNLRNNTLLILPGCFWLRQKPISGLAQMLYNAINLKKIYTYEQKWPWVYVEDVASLIWYIIENNIKGEIKMPALGFMSLEVMAQIVCEEFNESFDMIKLESHIQLYTKNIWRPLCHALYNSSNIQGWVPDSTDLEPSIRKTIAWYKANQWALKMDT